MMYVLEVIKWDTPSISCVKFNQSLFEMFSTF